MSETPIKKGIVFPVEEWMDDLLLDEQRQAYESMTDDQKRLVRLAYQYGVLKGERRI